MLTMARFKRVVLIVTDGLGVGKDSLQWSMGDKDANTLASACKNGLCRLPTWESLGLGLIGKTSNPYAVKLKPKAYVGVVESKNLSKNTVSGHWEMMGIITEEEPLNFLEKGFPEELITELQKLWDGRKIFGNKAGDGIKMIKEFGEAAEKKGGLIVYTSPDSTLQVAANEKVIDPLLLNKYCKKARKLLSTNPNWNVERVISRPYLRTSENEIIRTFNRQDFINTPPLNALDLIQKSGVKTVAIGKIWDIFGQRLDEYYGSGSDEENMELCIDYLEKTDGEDKKYFIFANLVQFDSHFGHRRDHIGYAEHLNKFDVKLAKLINALKSYDLLIITSDHGNDPLFKGCAHTRELIPLTIYSSSFQQPSKFSEKIWGLASVGNIILENFNLFPFTIGEKLFEKLL